MEYYTLNSEVIEYNPTSNTPRQYTIISDVTIQYLSLDKKQFRMNIVDVQSSTNHSSDLYNGVLIGTNKALAGNKGYSGTAEIKCSIFTYIQQNYGDSFENNTSFWQRGTLTKKNCFINQH